MSRRRGVALITALAVAGIAIVIITGLVLMTTTYAIRQRREADYTMALHLAEAGVNYELRYASGRLTLPAPAHLIDAPHTGSVNGISGSFNVHVRNVDGTTNWTKPNDMLIVATGTVGVASRTITVVAKTNGSPGSRSIFDPEYNVFATKRIVFKNASSAINGNMGVNGPAPTDGTYSVDSVNNGLGNVNNLGKPLTLAAGASVVPGNRMNPNPTGSPNQINYLANKVEWPTIDEIVTSQFPNGWASLQSSSALSAQWARVRMFRSQGRQISPEGTKPINTVSSSSTILDANVIKTLAEDNQSTNTLIFPPGDYYFTRVQMPKNGLNGPSPVVIFDTEAESTGGTPGPVRFWISGNDPAQDWFQTDIRYTTKDDTRKAQLSRIFYHKNNTFSINGNGIYVGVYGVKIGNGTGAAATIVLDLSSKVFGSIIADYITLEGGVDVKGITGIPHTTDYTWGGAGNGYAFAGSWKEVPWRDPLSPTTVKGATIFTDGTNR